MLEDLEQFPLKVRAGEDEGDILAGLNARELEMALDLRPWMQVMPCLNECSVAVSALLGGVSSAYSWKQCDRSGRSTTCAGARVDSLLCSCLGQLLHVKVWLPACMCTGPRH